MPRNVLPDAARVLPKAGQQLWLRAFNEALDQGLPESDASKEAWAAVKRAGYEKQSNGKWGKSMDNDMILNDDGTFVMSAPLMKINVDKRIVEGFATLDNIDEVKDVVDASASQEAFNEWFGNIREMHQKIAVGKAIDWKPDTYTDPDTGQIYDGIWVRAKISKGAEPTWQKVLDGTLAGFSIGGATLEKERQLAKDADGNSHQVWRITKYKLTELSLVDNPCNRLATISLIKSVDGSPVVEDAVSDGDIEKAYNGDTGEFADLSGAYTGVVKALESLRDEAIRVNADGVVACASGSLQDFRSKVRWEGQDAEYQTQIGKSEDANKEENTMEKTEDTLHENAESDINESETLTDSDKSLFRKFIDFVKSDKDDETSTAASTEADGEKIEKNEEGDEPEMNAEEIAKAIDDAGTALTSELEKSVDGKFEQVGESLKTIAAALEKVATADTLDELKKDLASQIEALAGRIEAVEKSGAVKKSGEDAGKTGEEIEKSEEGLWGGMILPDFLQKA